jgi:ABC-type amino acid transport system permease subunit
LAANGRGQDDLSDYFKLGLQGRGIGRSSLWNYYLLVGGAMALDLAVISAVAGAVLGLRYKVLLLVPAVMLAMMFAVLVGVARGDGVWSIVLMTMGLAAAVQVGYLAGVVLRAIIEWICASSARSGTTGLSGQLWMNAGQPGSWEAPGALARLRQPRQPQV